MEHKINHSTTLETVDCCNCGVVFAMPAGLLNRFRIHGGTFYCPSGHPQGFTKSEVDRLREKLDQQTRAATEFAERAAIAERAEAKAKQELSRVKKRINAGVCPCCGRTFQQLARHMKTKHPEVKI